MQLTANGRGAVRSRHSGPLRRPRRGLRRGGSQLICALAGFFGGLFAHRIPMSPEVDGERVAGLLFTVGFGVVSLVSLLFSVLYLVVQWAYSNLTPRLGLFRNAPIVWRTFAFAIGVFVFSVTAGLTIGPRDRVTVAVPAIDMLLALAALALMRTLQVRAFDSIQLAPTLDAITRRAYAVLEARHPHPFTGEAPPPGPPVDREGAGSDGTGGERDGGEGRGGERGAGERDGGERTGDEGRGGERDGGVRTADEGRRDDWPGGERTDIYWDRPSAVLQQVDAERLLTAAIAHGSVVVLRSRTGATVGRGTVLASVHGGPLPAHEVLRSVITGPERTFDQDPGLAFRLLADIALRSLSPAVNDPATAVQALDHIEELLTLAAVRDLGTGRLTDARGRTRLVMDVPDWPDWLGTAVDDVMVAAEGSPMVLLRLRALFHRLARECPEPRREAVAVRLRQVEAECSRRYPLIWNSAMTR
ncbi:DUF2254 family protein [Streptomyces sp. NPDC002055]|uniref:DUF2254 family protein n=1 Tax=Streptomyces sp. NPDC002055 TaxID=3154534 RepID=UPI0033269536